MSKSIKLNDDLYWDVSSLKGVVPSSGGNISGTVRVFHTDGTAGTTKNTYIQIGNDIDKSQAGNSRGILQIFGDTTYCTNIYHGIGTPTANQTLYLPDASGKILVDSKIVVTQGKAIGTDSSSIPSGSNFNKYSFSLNPGTYIIIVTASWQKNSNGFRAIGLASNATDFSSGIANGILLPTISDDTLREQLVCVVNPGVTTTYYVNVKQSSGSNLTCSCRLTYIGIAD